MSLNETIQQVQGQSYLWLSPKGIRGGISLVDSYEKLLLYEKMDENTATFAEKMARSLSDKEKRLDFGLVFRGTFKDVMGNAFTTDFLKKNSERIIAVYQYVSGVKREDVFVGYSRPEITCNYECLYLNFKTLLEVFERNNITLELDSTRDQAFLDEESTRFIIRRNLQKDFDGEKGQQFVKNV